MQGKGFEPKASIFPGERQIAKPLPFRKLMFKNIFTHIYTLHSSNFETYQNMCRYLNKTSMMNRNHLIQTVNLF